MLENLEIAVFSVAKNSPSGAHLLGTAFAVGPHTFATAAHVLGVEGKDIVWIVNSPGTLTGYQDTTNKEVNFLNVEVVEYDPVRDIAILYSKKIEMTLGYSLSGSDHSPCGASVYSLGFPHADHGRKVLTAQYTNVGARIILNAQGVKTKQIILNTQTRPGQSGGPVFLNNSTHLVGMILGSYAPSTEGSISLGGIDPQTLHQTTHAISAEYIKAMIE